MPFSKNEQRFLLPVSLYFTVSMFSGRLSSCSANNASVRNVSSVRTGMFFHLFQLKLPVNTLLAKTCIIMIVALTHTGIVTVFINPCKIKNGHLSIIDGDR